MEELKTHFQKLGVEPENSVRNRLEDCVRALRDRDAELDRLNTQLKSWGDENAQLRAQKDDLERTHQQRLDELRERLAQYGDSVTDYRREVDDLNADMRSKTDQLSDDYERNRLSLQNEIDTLSEERVVLIRRIDDLERRVRQEILTRPDPSLLVDGKILDQAGRSDEVYIDRGRIHHIVRGMTFEVFADQSSLNLVDGETGRLPRGKASLEVVNVGETTSTCKVVRAVRAQPPVRGDVIANAVYDPNYQFKFLIHGQFDIDGDGRPTESEAEYIRSLVLTWGGVVVSGDNLPGDLDFLVLGNEPPRPSTLPDDPPEHLVDRWVRMRAAYETYNKLMSQAQDAQIPVLNSNRFFILTGYTVR